MQGVLERPATPDRTGPAVRRLTLEVPGWLHPLCLIGIVVLGSALLATHLGDADYARWWRTRKYLDDAAGQVLLLTVAGMLLGGWLLSAGNLATRSAALAIDAVDLRRIEVFYRVCLGLTLTGYAFWVLTSLVAGLDLEYLRTVVAAEQVGVISSLKQENRPIAGLTTLMQFGPVAAAGAALLGRLGRPTAAVGIVFALSALRAFAFAERLALLEVVIPYVAVSLVVTGGRLGSASARRIAPVVALLGLPAMFAAFEYTRSWVYYRQVEATNYADWVLGRLLGYYVTGYNNSALIRSELARAQEFPYFSLESLWNAPLLGSLLRHPGIGGQPAPDWFAGLLGARANPEFNNSGSFLTVAGEWGDAVAFAAFVIAGAVVGYLYGSMRRGNWRSLLIFAVLLVGLLELPRYLYWAQGRAAPALAALALLCLWRGPDRPGRSAPRARRARPGLPASLEEA